MHIVYKHRTTLIGYVVIYFAIYLINCNVVENIPLGKNIIMVDLHKWVLNYIAAKLQDLLESNILNIYRYTIIMMFLSNGHILAM